MSFRNVWMTQIGGGALRKGESEEAPSMCSAMYTWVSPMLFSCPSLFAAEDPNVIEMEKHARDAITREEVDAKFRYSVL